MKNYELGDLVRVSITFKNNAVPPVVADPTTVSLKVETPDGTETTYTYAAAQITRTSTGLFRKDIPTTAIGTWSFQWIGVGVVDQAADGQFFVTASSFDTNLTGWNEMRDRVYTVVRDNANREFVTPDQVDIWLKEAMEEFEGDVLDAALIGAAQRVEHYEMAGYGTARAHAELLHLRLHRTRRASCRSAAAANE